MSKNMAEKAIMVLSAVAFILVGFVFLKVNAIGNMPAVQNNNDNNAAAFQQPAGSSVDVIPKGEPRIYGPELGVSYDDISLTNQQKADATIAKIGRLDTSIKLSGKDLERYIKIASQISCEYCCGVDSIITQNGQAACGCAHSYAMRGLGKYLITKHPNEFTDDQILEEMGKWKTLFFPGQMSSKAQVLKSKGIELNYINLASNKYRNIEG